MGAGRHTTSALFHSKVIPFFKVPLNNLVPRLHKKKKKTCTIRLRSDAGLRNRSWSACIPRNRSSIETAQKTAYNSESCGQDVVISEGTDGGYLTILGECERCLCCWGRRGVLGGVGGAGELAQ